MRSVINNSGRDFRNEPLKTIDSMSIKNRQEQDLRSLKTNMKGKFSSAQFDVSLSIFSTLQGAFTGTIIVAIFLFFI